MNSMKLQHATIQFKENGTPEATAFGDIYYNIHDGLAETRYVFLSGNNVPERLTEGEALHIGETGFGTGLNFLATWHAWKEAGAQQPLRFTSCEKFPLTVEDFAKAQGTWGELMDLSAQLVAAYPRILAGEVVTFEDGKITLDVRLVDVLEAFATVSDVSAWYLDGFSPSKNPDMWTEGLFTLMSRASAQAATGATFTAAGFIRAGLTQAGFTVERIKGFAFKRHMTIFKKPPFEKAP